MIKCENYPYKKGADYSVLSSLLVNQVWLRSVINKLEVVGKCLLKLSSELAQSTQPDETNPTAQTVNKPHREEYKVSINSPVSPSDHIPQGVKVEACLTRSKGGGRPFCLGVAGQHRRRGLAGQLEKPPLRYKLRN